jgi:hypothetical protein
MMVDNYAHPMFIYSLLVLSAAHSRVVRERGDRVLRAWE